MKQYGKRILGALLIVFALAAGMLPMKITAEAAETATVRIISTTDLHGQLASTNYDTAGQKSVGSLAQDYTLIKAARKEIKYGTTVTVDVGDTIYGYGSDYVYNNDGNEYMYAALSKMGYDAITLGNHDFDYGYSYVKKQLKNTGLSKLCVLSNVYDAVTEKHIWEENKLVSKTVTTTKGKKVTVKIGIIGVTRPGLTTYYNHTGILMTQDILESTKEQVKKLKAKGADLIIVAAHSGIGTANPEYFDGDVSYALSKIDGVDAVMCGHSHLNYPSSDANVQTYYELPNVNKKTGLMNGKPVVMVADHGAGIGIADLKIKISNGKVSLVSSKADIRYAKKTTASDPVILKYQAVYDKLIKKTYAEEIGQMEDDAAITNFFGMITDNEAIQLVNEAKIRLGLDYINTQNTEYKDYPVIAVSTYKKCGVESEDDYVNIDGTITMGDVLSIQSYYHDYSYVYYITGKQLKEWLEWTASAYETVGSKTKTGDTVMDGYITDEGMYSLIRKDWLADWSNFFMFDGIEYQFNLTQPPKYSQSGKLLNAGANRVSKLTYNGEEIADNTQLILVSDIITATKVPVASSVVSQRLYKSGEYSANILKNYIEELSQFGDIGVQADNNWNIDIPSDKTYIIRTSSLSEKVAKKSVWYQDTLTTSENYAYYKAVFPSNYNTDKSGPTLVVSPTITVKTNKDIPIIVQANDESKVTNLRYAIGKYTKDDPIWSGSTSTPVVDGQVLAQQNGTYSVWAMDSLGNTSVKYVKVSNINHAVLQVPVVNRITNKSGSVAGAGEPGATITVKASSKTYTTQVKQDGTYECKIAYQNADKTVKICQKEASGKTSDWVSVTVLRSGPNYPIVSAVNNKNASIKADINDENSQIFAIIGDTVYVAKSGGKKVFSNCSRNDGTLKIVETKYTREGDSVSLSIPIQFADTEVKVYAVDHIGRLNYPVNLKVKGVAPEVPVLYTACDGERYVYGYIPDNESIEYEIEVTVNGKTFSGLSNTNGKFKVEVDKLTAGDKIYVTASDIVNSKIRVSAKGNREIKSYEQYIEGDNSGSLYMDPITDKDTVITGTIYDFTGTLYVRVGDEYYDLDIAGVNSFEIPLAEPLKAGEMVCAVMRNEFSNIKETSGFRVQLALPDKPLLVNESIYTTTKTVKIESTDKCTATVKIGKNVYTSTKATKDETTGVYTYEVKIDKSAKGKTVYVYMENATGKSKKVKTTVIEKSKKEKE